MNTQNISKEKKKRGTQSGYSVVLVCTYVSRGVCVCGRVCFIIKSEWKSKGMKKGEEGEERGEEREKGASMVRV